MTVEEADFLRDRVALSQPRSYLAHLLKFGNAAAIAAAAVPWECPAARTAPEPARTLLDDAANLSLVHDGASILYNRLLAEANKDAKRQAAFHDELERWSGEIAARQGELAAWDRSAMWSRLLSFRPGLRPATIEFVNDWFDLAVGSSEPVNRSQTRAFLRDRELALKGRRARLSCADARLRQRGYSAWGQMAYRWGSARRILLDILRAGT